MFPASVQRRRGAKSPIARTLRRRRCRRPFRLLNLSSSQGLMNERHDATTSNSSMYERIKLLVSTNRQLQMPRRNTLNA